MKISENFQLREYNTFGINSVCDFFVEIEADTDIPQALREFKNISYYFVLGGGSNILFTKDFKGVIYYPKIKGIKKIKETARHIYIEAGAGENWDSFVEYCVKNNYSGIENLSLIPGNVGAAPVQNIGAYGVEVQNFIFELTAFDTKTNRFVKINNAECEFSYRNSIFKNKHKNRFIITSVCFCLNKTHNFVIDYGNVKEELLNFDEINLENIRKAIINIRTEKLPDYNQFGNAGSFFKNPLIPNNKIAELKNIYPQIPVYPVDKNTSKIAAGWLIDMCGWKGKKYKNTGTYKKQALVIINYGDATGIEIKEFSEMIQNDVYRKFQIEINPEVNIL